MPIGKAYSVMTGRQERFDNREKNKPATSDGSPAEAAASTQSKVEWLAHPVTVMMFQEFREEAKQLIDMATTLATTYHVHNNHQQIVLLLAEAETLKQLIEKYGRLN